MRHQSTLFRPGRLLAVDTPNRIVMGPLTRCRSNIFDAPFEIHEQYYAQRATAGMIISEATQISQQGKGFAGAPGIYSEAQVAGWSGVTSAVHAAGGRIISQLWHVGRISHPSLQQDGALPVAPSPLKLEGNAHTYFGPKPFVTPRALELEEIPGIVADYRAAAENAKAAGFDGIEIHSANGYLLDQFLRDGTNQRRDAYGGPVENRSRLLLEVVEAAASVWQPEKVGVRLSPSFSLQAMKDSDPERLFTYIAEQLSVRNVGYIHIVEPSDPRGDPNIRLFDPQVLREAFSGAYLANGGYNRSRAVAALEAGNADFIVFSRPFIANPDLPSRLLKDLPLAVADPASFYGGGLKGYTDYAAYNAPV
jgi:N-ethylmaleimide reductase